MCCAVCFRVFPLGIFNEYSTGGEGAGLSHGALLDWCDTDTTLWVVLHLWALSAHSVRISCCWHFCWCHCQGELETLYVVGQLSGLLFPFASCCSECIKLELHNAYIWLEVIVTSIVGFNCTTQFKSASLHDLNVHFWVHCPLPEGEGASQSVCQTQSLVGILMCSRCGSMCAGCHVIFNRG